jgi:hypothetical protein
MVGLSPLSGEESCQNGEAMENKSGTLCAPAERLTVPEVSAEHSKLAEHICASYFDFFPLPLIVVNSHRQIVFSNKAFLKQLGVDDIGDFLAKRPGEAMGCIYADTGENGCGTSKHCRECGTLRAIMESILGKVQSEHDCQLLLNVDNCTRARDLRVSVSPWEAGDSTYYVVTITDVGDEKRRQVLERIFFHDILNSAGGAKGLADILLDEVPEDAKEMVNLVRASLFGLVEEIQTQKQLLALEKGEYLCTPMTLQGLELIQSLAASYRAHPVAIDKNIQIDQCSVNVVVVADYSLLKRVLINMLTNALEATPLGGGVTLGLRHEDADAVFWVKNSKVMEERIILQVFKRSFSTKGEGRGLGTYSMKLLTENYLGGEVGFTSVTPEGTIFWVKLKQAIS